MATEHIAKVAVFGTFDILHKGHMDFFRQAKKAAGPGSRLVAVVARDSNVIREKGRPANDENRRLKAVQELDIVDEALHGSEIIDFSTIDRISPDIIALGYDQETPDGFEDFIRGRKIKVIRMKPYDPEMFKSSKIRERMLKT